MSLFVETHPVLIALVIFILRVLNNAVGTMRLIAMQENSRVLGFLLASVESLMFAFTAGLVLTDLQNIPNLAAYVLGFSVGGYVGLAIEQRYLNVYHIVDVVAADAVAHEIAEKLRQEGHGVTEMHGEGARGQVIQLRIVAHHADVRNIILLARDIQENVFITVEESRLIRGGWMRKQQQAHHR
ncbi:MAG: hypothetical protein KC496_05570 [Anaerolineae bacterium]|nr:hypothetical protein [Anaerolineae bacterium]